MEDRFDSIQMDAEHSMYHAKGAKTSTYPEPLSTGRPTLRRQSTKMIMGQRVSLKRSVALPKKSNTMLRADSMENMEKLKMVNSAGQRITIARAGDSTDLRLFQQLQAMDLSTKGEIQTSDLLRALDREKTLARKLSERNKIIILLVLSIFGFLTACFGTVFLSIEVSKEARVDNMSVLASPRGDPVQTNSAEFTVVNGQLRPRLTPSDIIDTQSTLGRRLEARETPQALQTALALVETVMDVRLTDRTLRNCVSIDLPQMHAKVIAFYRISDMTAECHSKALFVTTLGNFTLKGTTLMSPLNARLQNIVGRFYAVDSERLSCISTFAYATPFPDWESLAPMAYTMVLDHPCTDRCQTTVGNKPGVLADRMREVRQVLYHKNMRVVVSFLPNHPLQYRVRIADKDRITSFQVFNNRRYHCYTTARSNRNLAVSVMGVARNFRQWRLTVEGAKVGELWNDDDTSLPRAMQWEERTMPSVTVEGVRTLAEDAVSQWETQYLPALTECHSDFVPTMGDVFSEVFRRWYDDRIQSYGSATEVVLGEQWPGTSFKSYWLSVPLPKSGVLWIPSGVSSNCALLDSFATKALGFGVEKCTKADTPCFILNVITEPSNTKIHARGGLKVCPTAIHSDLEVTFWPKRCTDAFDHAFVPHLQSFGLQAKATLVVGHDGRGSITAVAPPGSPCHCPPCAPDVGSTLTMNLAFEDLRGHVEVHFDVHVEVDLQLREVLGLTWTPFAHFVAFERLFELTSADAGKECSASETCVAIWGDRFPSCINNTCTNECRWTERPMHRWENNYAQRVAGYTTRKLFSRFSSLEEAFVDCAAETGCSGISALWSDTGKLVSFELGSGSLSAAASHIAYIKGPSCKTDDLPPVKLMTPIAAKNSNADLGAFTTLLNQVIANGVFPFLTHVDDIPALSSDQRDEVKTHIMQIR